MSRSQGIIWDNPIPKNCGEMAVKLDAALRGLMSYEATRTESYMRENAPWTDQTANARNGLFAKPFTEDIAAGTRGEGGRFVTSGMHYGIIAYHTMPYGIWLEVRWNGRYAIILPTIDVKAPEVMAGTRMILAKLGVGGGVS